MKLSYEAVIETRAATRGFLLSAVAEVKEALMRVEAKISTLAQKPANRRDAELIELAEKYSSVSDDAPVCIEQTRIAKLVLSTLGHADSPIAALTIRRDGLKQGLRALMSELASYPDPNPPASLTSRLFLVFTPTVRTYEDFCRACPSSLVREMANSGETLSLNSSELKEYGSKLTRLGGYGADIPFAKIGEGVSYMQAQMSRAEPKSEQEQELTKTQNLTLTPDQQRAMNQSGLLDEINQLTSQINNWPLQVANGEWTPEGENAQISRKAQLAAARNKFNGRGAVTEEEVKQATSTETNPPSPEVAAKLLARRAQ